MKRKTLGWLLMAGMLFATSCSTDEPIDGYVSGEAVTVRFSISPEGRTVSTRSVEYPGGENYAQISDGSKAHMLIYAVYDSEYNLLDQYGRGIVSGDAAKFPTGYKAGDGQSVMHVEEFPTSTIELRLMRNQTYHIAFWAQSGECSAYDTSDLTKVKVNYKVGEGENSKWALNNDELRDAFCKVESFTVTGEDTREIILYRPLAQINVGTAGYDYECAVSGVNSPKYLYSKASFGGVAQYMDVVHNVVLSSEEDLESHGLSKETDGTIEITYDWARIPAYVNYKDSTDEELLELIETAQIPMLKDAEGNETGVDYNFRHYQEQFLRVDLNDTNDTNNGNCPYADYVSWSDIKKDSSDAAPFTETFKYLSMSYVLVPGHQIGSTSAYSTTLDYVTVWVGAKQTDGTFKEELLGRHVSTNDAHTVNNAPVQRNWRTNIFGSDMLTFTKEANINVVPDYNGEYNPGGSYKEPKDEPWVDEENSEFPEHGPNFDDEKKDQE